MSFTNSARDWSAGFDAGARQAAPVAFAAEERRRWAIEKALCLDSSQDPVSVVEAAREIEAYLKGAE